MLKFTGCLQLLEILEILEISWNLVDAPGKVYNFRVLGDFSYTVHREVLW